MKLEHIGHILAGARAARKRGWIQNARNWEADAEALLKEHYPLQADDLMACWEWSLDETVNTIDEWREAILEDRKNAV